MPHYGPISRPDLITGLKNCGCIELPQRGKPHMRMRCPGGKVSIPNPHGGAVGVNLLAKVLRQAGISREEWERC